MVGSAQSVIIGCFWATDFPEGAEKIQDSVRMRVSNQQIIEGELIINIGFLGKRVTGLRRAGMKVI
jgi:hypothetical protein